MNNGSRAAVGGTIRVSFGKLLLALLLAIALLLPVSTIAEELSCSRLPVLMKAFLLKHYSLKSMTAEIRSQAVDQMIKSLDPSRTMLYESDLEKLRPVLQGLIADLPAVDCSGLQEVHTILVQRARENEAIVKKMLGPGFKLDDTVELNLDVTKRPYVKTAGEKRELLRKVVHFQVENSVLAGIEVAEAKKQLIHRYELQTMRVVERNSGKLITSVAKSFALALDPHTSYLSPDNLEDLRIQMQLSLEGIGAALSSDNGFTIIEELIPGGSAERTGLLRPKDRIIAVGQQGEKPVSVIDMDLHYVINMIRGKKGTQVTLTILRQGKQTDRFDVTITREKISIKEQEAEITYETRTVNSKRYLLGVISLPSFYGDDRGNKSSYEDVKKLLAEAKRRNVDGIVLDLSRNGGGLLNEAVRLSGLFLEKGGVVAVKDSRGKEIIISNGSPATAGDKRKVVKYPAEDFRAIYTGPLVVLTTRLSASASEIVAGALKDYRRAVIVGTDHTFGKGSVQEVLPLPWDLGAMKVTTGLYFLPGGMSTQKTGVRADIKLPGWFVLDDLGEGALDYALPVQTIAPFLADPRYSAPRWRPVDQGLLSELSARSKARVEKDVKFAEILKNNKDGAGRQGIIRLADIRKEAKKEAGKKQESPAELRKKARDQYAPYVSEAVNILSDFVSLKMN